MAGKRLSTTIEIGGSIKKAFTNSLKTTNKRLGEVGGSIRTLEKRQKTLGGSIKEFGSLGKNVDGMRREYGELTDQIADLRKQQKKLLAVEKQRQRVGQAMSSFSKRLGKDVRAVRGVGVALTGMIGSGAAITHTFARSSEEMDQWASRLGMSTAALSQWNYAGSQFGVQGEAMVDALKELSMRTDEFTQTGAGPAADAIRRLGISQQELNKVSGNTEALFATVLNRLREVENVAARQRLVDELFGGQGGEQMAEMASASADELNALRIEADKLGVTVDRQTGKQVRKYMQEWRRVGGALTGLRNTIGVELLPIVTRGFGRFTELVKDNREQIGEWAAQVAGKMETALPAIGKALQGIGQTAMAVGNLANKAATLVGGFDNLAIGLAALKFSPLALSALSLGKELALLGGKYLPMVATGIKVVGTALLTTPLGLIATAIGGAALLIYKYWEPISDFFGNLWDGITAGAEVALDWIGKKLAWVGNAARKVGSFFGFGDDDSGEPSQETTRPTGRPGQVLRFPTERTTPPATQPAQGSQPAPVVRAGNSVNQVKNIRNGDVYLTVNQQPGEDGDQLARRVMQMIRDESRDDDGGNLYDMPATAY